MSSTIKIYDAFVFQKGGINQGGGTSALEPHVEIAGTGDPTTEAINVSKAVPAGTRVRLFDRAVEGGFDVFRIECAADLELWVQQGAPDDDSSAKSSLTWFALRLASANGAFRFTSDQGATNSVPANGAADSGDVAVGITDGGRIDARIQAIDVYNRGTADTTVTFSKLN